MRQPRLAVLLLVGLVLVAPTAAARDDAARITKPKAIAAVRAVLKANAAACGYRVVRLGARPSGKSWRVTGVVGGETKGSSVWTVAGVKPRPANALARRIAAGCPEVAPPEPEPQPPVEPPIPGPGAPATYVFGPELGASHQEIVRRGLDIGARYYRVVLGRELPPLAVYAFNDLESIIRAYAEHEPSSDPQHARQLWSGGQVAHATPRKVWFGPTYFVPGRPTASTASFGALQIAAHEAFHLFQYELVGQAGLSVRSLDEVPRAGPWWLAEGIPTYFAQLAVVREGLLRLVDLQETWKRSSRVTTPTLEGLMTFRGQNELGGDAYHVYTLATELLLRGSDPTLVFAYYQAIASGVAWPEAFAATFGRTHAAFTQEFEVYRRSP